MLHHLPNIISIFRAILVLPIAFLLLESSWGRASILILVAGVSDGIDGYLARRFQWQSQLGAILDPLADKLLIVIIFIIMAYMGIIPIWLAGLVLGRDLIILSGALAYRWLTKDIDISPLFISKVNTALQIIFVLALLYHLSIASLPVTLLKAGEYVVATVVIASGVSYVICWTGYYKKYLKLQKNGDA